MPYLGIFMEQNILAIFFTVLLGEFAAEFGDKTQLMLVGMTSKYKIRDIIIGTAAAILILNGIAVFVGGALNQVLNSYLWAVKFVAAAAFIYFAVTTLKAEDDEDEEAGESKIKFAPLAVAVTFFVAELGDKTQLTAVTFGAAYGLSRALILWIACSIGLFAADIIGMMAGYLLKTKAPEGLLKIVSFLLFTGFGFWTVYQACGLLNETLAKKEEYFVIPVWPVMGGVALIFVLLCILVLILNRRSKKIEINISE